jgi:hypothetical protein
LDDEVAPKKTILPVISKKIDKIEIPSNNKEKIDHKSNFSYGDEEEIY